MTTDFRYQALCQWLHSVLPGVSFQIEPASADASFRRYFRLTFQDAPSLIVMDSPPDKEPVQPFIHAAEVFRNADVIVPEILEKDIENGYLILSDLGKSTYLDVLTKNPDPVQAAKLYNQAFQSLIRIQKASQPDVFPAYDRAKCERDLNLFPAWYLSRHCDITLTDDEKKALSEIFEKLTLQILSQPAVFVHRDYIVRNLMVGENQPGILDFQDAVYGPITYDAVSLLEDAFISWDEELTLDCLIKYWEGARKAGLAVDSDIAKFHYQYDMMGLQRHLKVMGIFSRLAYRDNKTKYLSEIPRFSAYVRRTCERYRELTPLLHILDKAEGYNRQTVYSFVKP